MKRFATILFCFVALSLSAQDEKIKLPALTSTNAATLSDLMILETKPDGVNWKTRSISVSDFITSRGLSQGGSATNAIGSLNGQTNSLQTFSVGTAGTDISIGSTNGVHTYNFPTASSINRGALSSADWSTFNNKLGSGSIDTLAELNSIIGDANIPSDATTLTIAGTANEITSSAGAQDLSANRTWTLSLPTSLTFTGKTVTGGTFTNGTIYLDASGFNGNLAATDDTLQEVAQKLDDLTAAAGGDSITVDGAATVDPNFDDGGDINFAYAAPNITATVKADSVALGTDTTGNYVSDVAGTSQEITVTHTPSEGSTATISLPSTTFINQVVVRDYAQFTNSTISPSSAVYLDAAKKLATVSTVNNTELGYLDGVTSAIQAQIDSKAATATTITVAGTANEITSSAGAQDLSANRTWTLSLPAAMTFTGKTVTGGTFNSGTFGLNASGFNGNLTTSDDTLQEVAQKVDDLTVGVVDNWVASGTTNSTLPGIASINTAVVTNDVSAGSVTVTTNITASGKVRIADGTLSNPSIVLTSDDDGTGTGLYRSSANTIGFSSGGSQIGTAGPNGFFVSVLSIGNTDVPLSREGPATLQLGADSPTPVNAMHKGPDGSGTDISGGSMTIAAGRRTGTGAGGNVKLQTTPSATSTGSSAGTLTDRYIVVAKGKVLTDASAVSLFEVALPTLKMTGGKILATIVCTDGTDVQSFSQEINFSCVNKGGAYTKSITASTGDKSVTGGSTLTTTWTLLDGTDKTTVQLNADTSLTPSTNAFMVYYQIFNNSEQAITVL